MHVSVESDNEIFKKQVWNVKFQNMDLKIQMKDDDL